MIAPTFAAVGDTDGARTLADLTVTGYDAPEEVDEDEWEGGCTAGQFVLRFLSTSGSPSATYYWIDNGEVGPGWFINGRGTAIEGGASSVEIPAGTAIWTYGSGYKLVSAGSVSEEDLAFTTSAAGNVAVGNGTPVDLTLARLYVDGYTAAKEVDEDEWEGGCTAGQFVVRILTSTGAPSATYYWIDNGEVGPGWFINGRGTAIDGGAASVSIPAGQGLWVIGTGYTLNVPAPEL